MRLTGDMGQAALDFDITTLIHFLIVLTVITVVQALASGLSVLFTGRLAGNFGYKLRKIFSRHLVYLPFSKFEKKNSGEAISIYTNDLPKAVEFITAHSLKLVADIISAVISFAYMLTIDITYTLIFFGVFPIFIFMQYKMSAPIQKKAQQISIGTARFNAVVNDSLQNTSTVIAYSLENILESRYNEAYDEYFQALKHYILSLTKLVISGALASTTPTLFISVAAGISVINNRMSMAEFIAFTAVAAATSNWLIVLSQRLGELRLSAVGATRFNDNTMGTLERLLEDTHTPVKSDFAVCFESISFSYKNEADNLALKNVSFKIKKGDRVAFVGGSGSGKSTILKLMLGLYEPLSGDITVNGKNMDTTSMVALRRDFAYVPQDSFLFSESIRENITCQIKPLDNKDIDRLHKACEDAGILEFINTLPEKFETLLSESAENLSGGQRQRLAIARALYRNAPIVLFDEATSALDPITESHILEIFETLMEGRTVIMVAHRISVIETCHKIVLMDNGEISDIGSHTELLARSPLYQSLHAAMQADQKGRE
ncbi:MAG: ABC transporter ATP-binding protein/permease [Defluviitaleaceae bacterium]|nr:ABC transporter ATP-binding protein/permease [Defluviitaleaceae bacterium]